MGDPLSVASGVVGFVSLGIQLTQTLVDFYQAYKHLNSDITAIISNLEALLSTFVPLENTLKERRFQVDESHLVEKIESSIKDCNELIQELQGECNKFRKETNGFKETIKNVGRRAAYPFRQSTLQKLSEDIGEIRSNLSFAVDALHLRDSVKIQDQLGNVVLQLNDVRRVQLSKEIRLWLNAPDPTINHNEARVKRQEGTGNWLLQDLKFYSWSPSANSFLWLYGFAGCGKSVLCSTVIDRVFNLFQISEQDIRVGFYFFTFTDESKQDALRAISRLVSQISDPGDLGTFYDQYQASAPSLTLLLEQLKRSISKLRSVFIILDAIDESPRHQARDQLLDAIDEMRNWGLPQLHLLVTSRDEADIRASFRPEPDQEVSMRNDSIDTDVANWISRKLNQDRKLQKWLPFHDRIRDSLSERAKGV